MTIWLRMGKRKKWDGGGWRQYERGWRKGGAKGGAGELGKTIFLFFFF